MSKIAEQKALEEYPLPKEESCSTAFINQETFNSAKRTGYAKGYDQAMQDFIEIAERFMKNNMLVNDLEKHEYFCMTEENKSNFIKDFKNYMEKEL